MSNETWFDLVRYRRDVEEPSLAFYVDKVARRRWFAANGIPCPKVYAVKYESELTTSGDRKDKELSILKLLPDIGIDFAAKPTHLSCSGGVWLPKHVGATTYIGNGKKKFQPANDFSMAQLASSLTDSLETVQELCGGKIPESWALQKVHPGILIDERFTGWEAADDNRGGMEFKVFTIWGKAWMIVYRPGYDHVGGFFYPNGTALPWGRPDPVPSWLDFGKLVTIAEQLGHHKDMFRTDIFVGIPASKRAQLREPNNFLSAVEINVSETEIHPTPYGKDTNEVFEEGARIWLAGYGMGRFTVVSNSEVPPEYIQSGELK
eukprot:scaffold6420_cov168-Amphora_coffeaeformis.AAC.32